MDEARRSRVLDERAGLPGFRRGGQCGEIGKKVHMGSLQYTPCLVPKLFFKPPTFPSHHNFP